jgi:ABC-type Fe3+-hydroxamate transport system substrate-binding protein
LKKLLNFQEKTYDQTGNIFKKQEKMEKIIGQLSSQIKDISEKLDSVEGKKKLEWWEVCIFTNIFLCLKFLLILFIAICR